jgi:hypothetical protein
MLRVNKSPVVLRMRQNQFVRGWAEARFLPGASDVGAEAPIPSALIYELFSGNLELKTQNLELKTQNLKL